MYTDIKVGYTCNNHCIHCVVEPIKVGLLDDKQNIDSSTEEVKGFIDEAVVRGSKYIVLTGGEVTIRKDFKELVNYALSKSLGITIQTNARHLRKPGMLDFLEGTPPIQFVVAIHGPNADIHDEITRVKHSFDQTMSAIRKLNQYENALICGKIVISKLNYNFLAETVEFLIVNGVTDFMMAFPHAEDFPEKTFNRFIPTYNSLKDPILKTMHIAKQKGVNVELETIPYCIIPEHPEYWRFSSDIHYIMNGQDDPGFIKATGEDDVKEWEKVRKKIKTKGEKCKLCVLDKICEGPWHEYVDYFGNEEFVPITDPTVVEMI